MTLHRDDFVAFFREVHDDDRAPFAWQERLLDHVLDTRSWPATIDAPTGSGKTALIDVHVFALALTAAAGLPLPPRRLSMVVGRRVLVDDQHRHAVALRDKLAAASGGSVLAAVAEQLWRLRDLDGERDRDTMQGESPLITARLRGGEPPTRMWTDEPSAAAVLCATPEMWGSRLLFRGYGSSWRSWPRAAGLLAFDSVVVVDEAHLSAQLLTTARRVGELARVAESKALDIAPLQVVATTATPGTRGGPRVGVDPADLDVDVALVPRLRRPKPVTLVGSADWAKSTPRNRAAGDIAAAVVDAVAAARAHPDAERTVGCFVNTVARAVGVAEELRKHGLRVVMLCGQVRPVDVAELRVRYEGLLDTRGNGEVDVIVSTQTLEVGVDLDLVALVTELAGASALVQRTGRVNRRGRRASGPVSVIVPTSPLKGGTRSGPYGSTELDEAWRWIERRAADPDGLAPWAIRADPPPSAEPRRPLLQRPEWAEAEHWARTSDNLAAGPELDLWLAEDLPATDLSLGLVVRANLPDDEAETKALLRALPPRRHEVFPVPFTVARDALARAHDEGALRAFVDRGGDVAPLTWAKREGVWRADFLRPGDVVVVDAAVPLFTAAADGSPQVLVPAGDDTTRHTAADVLEAVPSGAEPRPGDVVHRIELDLPTVDREDDTQAEQRRSRERLRNELADLRLIDDGDERDHEIRAALGIWLDNHDETVMAGAAGRLLRSEQRAVDVHVLGDDEYPTHVAVVDRRRAVADEDVRQEWFPPRPGRKIPTLRSHQSLVGGRAERLATKIGLGPDLVDALGEAGRHHDDGKQDRRFQIRLGTPPSEEPRAKGDAPSPLAARRREERAGLPPGWRHEQRSVADAWSAVDGDEVDRDLVLRLVGTSHGHGRASFPHVATELLLDPDDVVLDLFDHGRWDEIVERTHRGHGLWGCAYLEAILRAADGQVSAEGR